METLKSACDIQTFIRFFSKGDFTTKLKWRLIVLHENMKFYKRQKLTWKKFYPDPYWHDFVKKNGTHDKEISF